MVVVSEELDIGIRSKRQLKSWCCIYISCSRRGGLEITYKALATVTKKSLKSKLHT
jgi:hypothetical protein